MRTFFYCLKLTCSILGCVIGAGFVSGTELVCYFNCGIGEIIFCSVLFSLCLILLFLTAKNFVNPNEFLSKLYRKPKYVLECFNFSSLIFACSMLAGLNYVFAKEFGFTFPLFSVGCILCGITVLKYGLKGMENVNIILIPLMVFAIVFTLFYKGKVHVYLSFFSLKYTCKSILYVCINVFNLVPIALEGAKKYDKKTLVISSVLFGLIFCVLSVIISFAIGNDDNAKNFDMPILKVIDSQIITVAIIIAIITSFFSSFFLPFTTVKNMYGKRGVFVLCVAVFLLSLLGFKTIVLYVYPLIFIMGFILIEKCLKYKIKKISLYKNLNLDNNIFTTVWRKIMGKKKKNKIKIAKLTDEEYNRYIMSLKDEKPPKAVRELQK